MPEPFETLAWLRGGTSSIVARASDLRGVDVVFVALHGGSGEDVTLQAVLDAADAVAASLGLPVVVKPNKQGSTVGLSVVREARDLDSAIALAAQYDDEVMVERFVAGRELTVGILEGTPLAVGEIKPRLSPVFDYASKYQPGGADEIFPADLPPETTRLVQSLGVQAHRAVKAGPYSRADFRLDAAGQPWCLEVNTVPGMTSTSLLPQSAEALGVAFPELCDRICRAAVKNFRLKTR